MILQWNRFNPSKKQTYFKYVDNVISHNAMLMSHGPFKFGNVFIQNSAEEKQ